MRSLGFRTDLAVRRIAGSQIVQAGDRVVVRSPDNPRYWWGNFVLVPGVDAVQGGVALFREAFPGARHMAVGVDGCDGMVDDGVAVLGLQPDISVVLVAASDNLAPGARVQAEIRTLSDEGDWRQLFELRIAEATSDGPPAAADDTYQGCMVAEARGIANRGGGVYLGAFVDHRLASALGVVSAGAGIARYQHVQTAAERRRQGLAGRLLIEGGRLARDRWGAQKLVIVADPDGSAINLYRSLGFQEVERQLQLQRSHNDSGPEPS